MKNNGIITIFFLMATVYADTIQVYNESELSLHAAPYYTYTSYAERVTESKNLLPRSATVFERPKMRWDLGGRELAISITAEPLKPKISSDELRLLAKQNIANPIFSNFYVALVNGKISSFNAINWRIMQPILSKARKNTITLLAATVHRLRILWQKPPYNKQEATVRVELEKLCAEEQAYVKARRSKVQNSLKKIGLSVPVGKEPVIALCGSGGGIRATVAFNGSKNGLAKAELLDAIMYESTLSGSTWETAPSTHFNNTPAQYRDFLKTRLPEGLLNKRFSLVDISSSLFKKFIFDKPLSMIDLYGSALTSLFLETSKDKEPSEINLSEQAEIIKNGLRPMPIYTAITSYQPYIWVYFTPYEIGSKALGGFIPPWALGRKFNNSVSINHVPGDGLGYLLGIFGYAIGINLKEALIHIGDDIKSDFIRSILQKVSHETAIGNLRLFPGEVNNFTFGMLAAPYGRKKTLTLLDAGIHYNLPMPPLLEKERAVDVIIVCDNSGGTVGAELRKTEEYFKEKGLPFPSIDYGKVPNKVTIFSDQDHPETPTLIYLPLVKNDNYSKTFDPRNCPDDACSTFNFKYTPELVDLLSGLTEFTIIENKDLIVSAIKAAITKKQKNNMLINHRNSK